MSTEIIVCPDCGQRYSPAKGESVLRVETWRRTTRKVERVEAQDVRLPQHKRGRHHDAHASMTHWALRGWVPVPQEIAEAEIALDSNRPAWQTSRQFHYVWLFDIDRLESIAIELDDLQRQTCEELVRAARAVRLDWPWWRAYLDVLGVSPEESARGLTINASSRGDVLFRTLPRRPLPIGPTLRGVL